MQELKNMKNEELVYKCARAAPRCLSSFSVFARTYLSSIYISYSAAFCNPGAIVTLHALLMEKAAEAYSNEACLLGC